MFNIIAKLQFSHPFQWFTQQCNRNVLDKLTYRHWACWPQKKGTCIHIIRVKLQL